jgi:hypothetical protein
VKLLGKLTGRGTLASPDGAICSADYDLDGYLIRPGTVVASGELHVAPGALEAVIDRRALRLTTAEGRILPVRFTGKLSEQLGEIVHVDISEGLPAERDWSRR